MQPDQMEHRRLSRRVLFGVPLAVTALGGVGFAVLLERMRKGTYDPQGFNNPLVGHQVPQFSLAGVDGYKGFDQAQLVAQKKPILVNFFASWCLPCVAEAPYLAGLSRAGLNIWGINYEDKPKALAVFLAKHGNPFRRIAADPTGRTAINWGVYGVPESFLIAPGGIVRWHIAQPLIPEAIDNQLRPALASLSSAEGP